jgi:hypothetical protein
VRIKEPNPETPKTPTRKPGWFIRSAALVLIAKPKRFDLARTGAVVVITALLGVLVIQTMEAKPAQGNFQLISPTPD